MLEPRTRMDALEAYAIAIALILSRLAAMSHLVLGRLRTNT